MSYTKTPQQQFAEANFLALLKDLPQTGIIAGLDANGTIMMVSWSVSEPPYRANYAQKQVLSSDVTHNVAGTGDISDVVEGYLNDQGLFATIREYSYHGGENERLVAAGHWQHGLPHVQMAAVRKPFDSDKCDFEFYEPHTVPGIGYCLTSNGHSPLPVTFEDTAIEMATKLWEADRHSSVLVTSFPEGGYPQRITCQASSS